MIVVKVELHSAITGRVTLLGKAIIHNVNLRGNGKRADYDVCVGRKSALDTKDVFHTPLRRGHIANYPRLSYNVWRLVIRALRSAFPEEDK